MKKKSFLKAACIMCAVSLAVPAINMHLDAIEVVAADETMEWADLEDIFPDSYVREKVQSRLSYNGITEGETFTQEDLNTITSLSVTKSTSDGEIDLTGVEKLTGLESISVDGNIKSLAPLNGLKNLENLALYVENVVSFEDMSDVTTLKTIRGISDSITSLDGLEKNTKMEKIDFYGSDALTDISACAYFPELKNAEFYACDSIEDISALAGLQKLESVDVYNSQVKDISALKNKTTITKLDIGESNVFADETTRDVTCDVLKTLTNVKKLGLRGADADDVVFETICGLTKLTSLDLLGNDVTNIASIVNLTELYACDIGGNAIYDFRPLASLTKLNDESVSNVASKNQYVKFEVKGNTISNPFFAMDGSVIIPVESEEWVYNATDNTITFTDDSCWYEKFAVTEMDYNGNVFDMNLYISYDRIADEITITKQPTDVTCTEGDTITLSVEAQSDDSNFTYQWYKDETVLSGETSANLVMDAAELSDAGSYKCIIKNATSSATSNKATVTVEKKQEPTTEEPTTEEPTTEEPTTEEPTTEEPTTEEPTTEETTTLEPETTTKAAETTTIATTTVENKTESTKQNTPKTGDNNMVVLFGVLMLVSAGVVAGKKKIKE